MSLLLNEDFSVYRLRLAYLQHIHDGVGERLITVNTSVLNNPAFRAAGWLPDNGAVRRCYSPPIPTTGAGVASEYFQVPRKATGVSGLDDDGDVARGGMVTGHHGSEDTIGAGAVGAVEMRKRRRRREQLEEDDSSDLSDDSDDDERSAAHGIKFSKMPIRNRTTSDTSPENTFKSHGSKPALNVISPSQPPDAVGQGLRRGSLGQVEAIKQRARRDTATSSDMSSENELDPTAFGRKLPGRPGAKKSVMLAERIQEEELRDLDGEGDDSDFEDGDVGEASDISDEFEVEDSAGISHTPNMLGIGVGGASDDTAPLKPPLNMPPAVTPNTTSPKKPSSKDILPKLPKLPPGRPISTVIPRSLITVALRGSGGGSGEKAFQPFADLSGKGDPSPLWIKIYVPFSEKSTTAIEVPIRRQKEGNPVTVVELIGLALWRYNEESFKPEFTEADQTVNRWTLRIVEDEEIDFDFPALGRTRPVTDFTSNNNRPPQRRARDKPWDEFGLVKATNEQFKENQELTPQFNDMSSAATTSSAKQLPQRDSARPAAAERSDTTMTAATGKSFNPARNPITGPAFTLATSAAPQQRKDTGTLLDAPQQSATHSTPRMGAPRTVTVHFTDPHSFSQSNLNIPTTSDTYIAEIFDHACKRLNLDKALYVLKVHGTQTVAPSDRTIEALGDNLGLDLVRRRFIGAGAGDGMFGLGLSGSPGSSSPNAPLELIPTIGSVGATGGGTGGGASKRRLGFALHNKPDATPYSQHHLPLDVGGKRYNVLRKQPLSFAPSHPRTLIITAEYLQILPAAPDSLAAPTGKVSNVAMTSIIGVKVSRKHPKMVRVLVYREKETKRYDFECASHGEAEGVCADVRKGLEGAREAFAGGGGGFGG